MTHKIITFFTFCWVLCLPIYAQTMNIDSLISVVEKMPNDTANIRIIDEIGYEVGEDDLENALYFFRKAYKMAKQLKSDVWIPWVQINLGATFADLGKSDSALMYFQAAQKIYEQQGNKLAIRKVFEKMSWLHEYLGEYDKALNYSFKALNISEITKDEKNTAENFLAVSDILSAQKKYKEALIYAEKAYNIQKRIKDWEGLSFSAQSISIIWIELEDYEKAFAYIEEALEPQKSFENKSDLPYLRETRGEVFLHLKKYSEALADFQYSLAFAQKSRNLELELQCISNIGHAYNLLGQYKRALPYHLECYRRLSENKVGAMTDINLSWLAEAYAGIKKYDSAYYFYKLYKTVDDSLLGFDNQSKMNELRIKYETEKKEEQISEQNRNLWLLGGALGMAVLGGAGLFFLTYKLRKRNTEKDNLLKEKEFLIKEVHHRVKNNLQVLSSLLYLQSRHIKDEAALDAVREGQNRVEAMGLIHQKLYMGDALATVEMKDYLHNLGEMLLDAFGIEDDSIVIDYQVDNLQLDVDTAIPLGLIINELITNSLKYAFSKDEKGKIIIALWKNEIGNLCLKVSDNGKGIIQTENALKSTSFGSNLIKVLSQKLKGKPEITKTQAGYSTYIECGSV